MREREIESERGHEAEGDKFTTTSRRIKSNIKKENFIHENKNTTTSLIFFGVVSSWEKEMEPLSFSRDWSVKEEKVK